MVAQNRRLDSAKTYFLRSPAVAVPSLLEQQVISFLIPGGASHHHHLGDGGTVSHLDLTNQQGGTTDEHYHLVAQDFADVDWIYECLAQHEFADDSHPAQYGSMYADNAAQNIVISFASTYTKVTPGFLGGSCNSFTFQNNAELLCNKAGHYFATWSFSGQTQGPNENIEGAIGVNDVYQANTSAHTFVPTNGKEFNIGGAGVLNLAVGDVVCMMLNNNTNADDITLSHANMTLVRLTG